MNHRNEAAAVSLLLQRLEDISEFSDAESVINSTQLSKHCESLWPDFLEGDNALTSGQKFTCIPAPIGSTEDNFQKWCVGQQKFHSAIQIATFDGLRGCSAIRDIAAGDLILSIPRAALIYEDTVKNTDLGRMLAAVPGLTVDNLLIIYTMIDRFDPESVWAQFWASLPTTYGTGLSFPPSLVAKLQGTAAYLEIGRGQAHLQSQYEATRALFDILLAAYPQHLEAGWFRFENYLWACELWYSYAFEVEFPPSSKSKTVMVPFACHVNHSPWPHVVRYGRIQPVTDTLDYPAFRPCRQGSQVFISYGPVPNLKLLTYYGFVIHRNPHDLVPLTLELPDGLDEDQKVHLEAALTRCHLGLEHNLRDGPLALPLLACMRLIVATKSELKSVVEGTLDPLAGPLNCEGEMQALDTLLDALLDLRAAASGALRAVSRIEVDEGMSETPVFCRVYVEGQLTIIERAVSECHKLRQMPSV